MIEGTARSTVESEFIRQYRLLENRKNLTGDCEVNSKIKSLDIVVPLQKVRLNTEGFASFIKERNLPNFVITDICQRYKSFDNFDNLEVDLTYTVKDVPKAFVELNGPHHYSQHIYGEKTFYETLVHDYAKRCLAKKVGIPLMEVRIKEPDTILLCETERVVKFFKNV